MKLILLSTLFSINRLKIIFIFIINSRSAIREIEKYKYDRKKVYREESLRISGGGWQDRRASPVYPVRQLQVGT